MDQHDVTGAIALLEKALATTIALLGPDRTEVADVLYNLAAARRDGGDKKRALADFQRCATINEAHRPGSERHQLALALVANMANDLGEWSTALAATDATLTMPTEGLNQPTAALLAVQRARTLIGLRRNAEARPFLEKARAVYTALSSTERIAEIDRLLAQTR
jgi:tetratricopeptide (TPR) repeat protein